MARRDAGRTRLNRLPICCALWTLAWASLAPAAEPISDDPRIQAALERAIGFLRQERGSQTTRGDSLVALALLKSGEPADSPRVAGAIARIRQRVNKGVYQPHAHHYYTAGIDMMLLEAADPDQYRPELEAILKYILAGQLENGSWYYPSQNGGGDTSITQYAMLGLWSASRAGLDVPAGVWDRAAAWHIRTQRPNGAFAYHPLQNESGGGRRTMTAAAIGSLHIARMHLFSNRLPAHGGEKTNRRRKFRFLEPIDITATGGARQAELPDPPDPGRVNTELAAIDAAVERGLAWLAADWAIDNNGTNIHYYLYALERMTALADIQLVGEHDWYAEAAEFLLRTQAGDGSWASSYGKSVDTAFGLLCLGKATARMLHRGGGIAVGAGLLAGGRGLPDNLAQVQIAGGEVKTRKLQGPLDELLNELENPRSTRIASAQAALLEKVQLGNREELIGQTARLARLADDPRAEVRRTALWALGRSGDVRYTPVLIDALDDPDLAVLIEARNALCTLSRKPRGFGLPHDPYADLPEEATDNERALALDQWRATVARNWRQWYLAVRPYDQRDGLPESWQMKKEAN